MNKVKHGKQNYFRLSFKPEPLLSCQKLYHLQQMGLFEISDEMPDITFNWNYTGTRFNKLADGAVNNDCTNTSKSYVDKIFTEIYGYSSRSSDEICVEKPDNTNGLKDCHVVDIPIYERKPDCFYQKVLFDREGIVEEKRFVIMHRAVYCITKMKKVSFDNICGDVLAYRFTPLVDCTLLDAFCTRFGLHYGEVDVINYDGLDYIIDVNPTAGDRAFFTMNRVMAERYKKDYYSLTERWLQSVLSQQKGKSRH